MDNKIEKERFLDGDERVSFFNAHNKLKSSALVQLKSLDKNILSILVLEGPRVR